jgi:hypothetical protein
MSDIVDRANDRAQQELDYAIAAARGFELKRGQAGDCRGFELKRGQAGDCDICGQWSGRLVDGACAPCRDKYKLP